MSSSAWSIWNSNSPNMVRRYSTSTGLNSAPGGASVAANLLPTAAAAAAAAQPPKSSCQWEPSADNKYLIGYIAISRQDLALYHDSLGFQLRGGRPTHDGQLGALVEHVVPGSLMNIVCKLRVGDEIVEWNGFDLRNKRPEEVCDITQCVRNIDYPIRLVAVRLNSSASSSAPRPSAC